MAKKVSVAGTAQQARRDDARIRKQITSDVAKGKTTWADSFMNVPQSMGIGAASPLTTASYGFNPITRIRVQLEWIHRGSWLGGQAVDVVADDMTRAGVDILGMTKPGDISDIEEEAVRLGIWNHINETIKWSRLYGGCLAVMMIDGHDMSTPFRLEAVGKGQFQGLLVLDRWMVNPSLENLVTDPGPDMGLPKFYTITADAPALPSIKIHHTRCIRLDGIKLPYWQRLVENMWGISVLERLYDRMVAFDSATTGAAQLVYKAYIRTYKIKDLRDIVSHGGPALASLSAWVDFMRRYQGNEGITLMDMEDEFEGTEQSSAFTGLDSALTQFGQQLSGALQIPLVRLFGQSPSGFNSGDTDLIMYYDGINQKQVQQLKVGMTTIYRCIGQSLGKNLPHGFGINFRSLWQLQEGEKATIANTLTDAITKAQEAGLITDKVAAQELKQSSKVTGVFTNISDKDINAMDDEIPPPDAELVMGVPGSEGELAKKKQAEEKAVKKPSKAKDHIEASTAMKLHHDLDVVVENARGSMRTGLGWTTVMPDDYGYLRMTEGADGDQLDCYIGPAHESTNVWIINQNNHETGRFDELKVMLGYDHAGEALHAYFDGFSDGRGPERLGGILLLPMDKFKQWVKLADHTQPTYASEVGIWHDASA